MKNIIIRQLKPDDMDKILDLLRTRFESDAEHAEKRTLLMEWCAFRNPFADDEPTYFIAEDRGDIVAHLGRMPTIFIINGKHQKGYYIHDLYVNPEYREKGMGFFLSISLYKAIEESSRFFCCLIWTSDLNLKMQRSRGYYELKAGCYLKVLNPAEILRRLLRKKTLVKMLNPILTRILDVIDLIILRLIPSYRKITKIDRFDSRFDDFYQSILHKIGICSYKQSSYLNWKFIDRPFSKTTVFAAQEKGQMKGVVIISPHLGGKEYPEGMILDIIADPEDKRTIVSLIKASVSYFRRQKVFSIRCCLTDRRFIKILRRFLFFSLPRGEPFMLANMERFEQREILTDINNWFITYSESDVLMLRL